MAENKDVKRVFLWWGNCDEKVTVLKIGPVSRIEQITVLGLMSSWRRIVLCVEAYGTYHPPCWVTRRADSAERWMTQSSTEIQSDSRDAALSASLELFMFGCHITGPADTTNTTSGEKENLPDRPTCCPSTVAYRWVILREYPPKGRWGSRVRVMGTEMLMEPESSRRRGTCVLGRAWPLVTTMLSGVVDSFRPCFIVSFSDTQKSSSLKRSRKVFQS